MSRLDGVNLAALLAALVIAAIGTLQFTRPSAISSAAPALEATPGITRVVLDDGRQAVLDAQGSAHDLKHRSAAGRPRASALRSITGTAVPR